MKNTSLKIRTIIILAVTLVGIYLVIGPRGTLTKQDFSWSGIKKNLEQNISLGLDLKGGSHLVMRVKTDEYLKTLTENNAQAALTALQDANVAVAGNTVVAENGTYSVSITAADPLQTETLIEEAKKKVDFASWGDPSINGGTVTWTLPSNIQTAMKKQAVDQALKIIESRINAFGVKEPTLQRHGSESSGQILLQMPGVDDPERVKKLLNADSNLQLMKVVSPPSPAPVQTFPSEQAALQSLGGPLPPNRKIYEYLDRDATAAPNADPKAPQPKQFVVVEYPSVVDGSELRDANAVSRTGNTGDYQISFSLKPAGAAKFGDWTSKNINNYMGVVLNDQVKSIAYIKSRIDDQGEISGKFTKSDADDLALTLRSGALPAKIEYQEERTVGPSLGADSIRAGVTASVAGLIFIVLFMLFYYRGAGINAVIALVLNMVLTLAALIMLDSTLTLPGIAGLILGIGMAVDSNVLIFERMREELRAGHGVAKAVALGFDRAFITIIDTHVTTIISAIILYLYGSGPIRGFAVTLILGLLINLFSAVFVSRTIFMWLLERNPEMKKLSI
jgi:preprotein translocase subunit SecD